MKTWFRLACLLVMVLVFFANKARAQSGVFSNVTATVASGLPGVFNSSVAWGDYDNDGRLDFLVSGDAGSTNVTQLWRNTGSGFTNVPISGLPAVYYGSVAWGDYDNDGRLDFLLTGTTNESAVSSVLIAQLWRNTGSGFSNVTASMTPNLPGVYASSVAWGDYNNDGWLDFLLTGSSGTPFTDPFTPRVSQLWRNTGHGFVKVPIPDIPAVVLGSVAWGDYNNDGRLDLVIAGSSTNGLGGGVSISRLYRNTGNGFSNVMSGLGGTFFSSVAWGDYDNDGWLDLLITGSPGNSLLRQNTGAVLSDVTAVVAPGLPGVLRGSVAWGDYDNDGRLDFLLTGNTGSTNVAQLWRNTGSGFTNVPIPGLAGVERSSVAWGDYDNDGQLDFLLTGTTNGTFSGAVFQLWRNNLSVSNAPPAAPTGLAVATSQHDFVLSWNPATDDHTPPVGHTYNVRIGTVPGGSDIVSPMSLADGRPLLPRLGNAQHAMKLQSVPRFGQTYYWSVQAVDTAFAGSPFSSEQSFTPSITLAPANGIPVTGDTNGDGVVDQSELHMVLNNYWQTSPPAMEGIMSPGNTVFRFGLTNLSGLNFHALASTNVAAPLNEWENIGTATLSYQFDDPDATNHPARFYQLVWP